MPKKKDAALIAAVIVVAAALLAVSRLMPGTSLEGKTAQETLAPDAVEYLDEPAAAAEATVEPAATEQPVMTSGPEETAALEQTPQPDAEKQNAQPEAQKQAGAAGPMPPKQTEEVAGYVILTVNGRQYGDPIAMDRDKIITIKQDDGKVNKVHITPEKVYMESSTCENQDCVQQGEITLDNYKTRILSTFVICLPNNVSIEMVPAEE